MFCTRSTFAGLHLIFSVFASVMLRTTVVALGDRPLRFALLRFTWVGVKHHRTTSSGQLRELFFSSVSHPHGCPKLTGVRGAKKEKKKKRPHTEHEGG